MTDTMRDIDHAMLLILSLDSSASLSFSEYTRKWYVSSQIEIGDGATLTSITAHEPSPDAAVLTYFGELTMVDSNDFKRVLVTDASGESRQHWRWNGAAFVQTQHLMPTVST